MTDLAKPNYDWTQEDLDHSIARARASTQDGVWQVHAQIPGVAGLGSPKRDLRGTLQETVDVALTVGLEDLLYNLWDGRRLKPTDDLIFQVIVRGPPQIVDGEPVPRRAYVVQSRRLAHEVAIPERRWMIADGDKVMIFDLDDIRARAAEIARKAAGIEGVTENIVLNNRETTRKTVEVEGFVVVDYPGERVMVDGPNWSISVPRESLDGPDEVGHAMEHWLRLEFSEDRVDALVDRYRDILENSRPPEGMVMCETCEGEGFTQHVTDSGEPYGRSCPTCLGKRVVPE